MQLMDICQYLGFEGGQCEKWQFWRGQFLSKSLKNGSFTWDFCTPPEHPFLGVVRARSVIGMEKGLHRTPIWLPKTISSAPQSCTKRVENQAVGTSNQLEPAEGWRRRSRHSDPAVHSDCGLSPHSSPKVPPNAPQSAHMASNHPKNVPKEGGKLFKYPKTRIFYCYKYQMYLISYCYKYQMYLISYCQN